MRMRVGNMLRRALAAAGLQRAESPLPDADADTAAAAADDAQSEDLLPRPPRSMPRASPGEFVGRSFSNSHGTRAYKLYVPKSYRGKPVPLIVMLHGCTQNPDDIAAGTRMNELADQDGFLVVYPAQTPAANGMNCWNWFNRKDQVRDRGEPALIAGITREVMRDYGADPRKVFVAGISAGAAMAVIMATVYPELFAAVGVHSGLAYGAAHNATSAFVALRGGNKAGADMPSAISRRPERPAAARAIPTIVFHGDQDATVDPRNGIAVVDQVIALAVDSHGPLQKTVQDRMTVNGREYTATIYRSRSRRPIVEYWELHGAGHAWSGGSSNGSFTDESGPDASAEMVRFFLSQGAKD
jgi:poly(hydroxyalkanoate) depolymerase family esterase